MRHPKFKRRFDVACRALRISKTELAKRLQITPHHLYCMARGDRAMGHKTADLFFYWESMAREAMPDRAK